MVCVMFKVFLSLVIMRYTKDARIAIGWLPPAVSMSWKLNMLTLRVDMCADCASHPEC